MQNSRGKGSMLTTATPEDCGMDSNVLAEAFEFLRGERKALHSVLVVRNGCLVVEAHAPGQSPSEKHIMNSCTKSVLSALVGIAIEKGILRQDDRVLDYFPEYPPIDEDKRRSRITIHHLLSMSSGISWPQYGPNNVSDAMGRSDDWIQFILERPMAAEPGTVANYSNGDSHLVSAILAKVTEGTALDFAREALFAPLGIADVHWDCDPQGRNIGSATMYLLPADMVKIGCLYLSHGEWGQQQIVAQKWVDASWSAHTVLPTSGGGAGYGYYWWRYPERGLYEAWGGACQRIGVMPAAGIVVVITADIPDDTPRGRLASTFYDYIQRSIASTGELPPNPAAVQRLRRAQQL
jgi:CubicO group peptidase (beta-lactamase class C family)